MAGPFTFPVAQAIPFEPNRNGSEIGSENVQDAIEEVKLDALNNDRFLLLAAFNGNANAGRYLEYFTGIDSSIAPILYSVPARITDIVAATTSASATCTIQFVDIRVLATPVVLYTVTFNKVKRVVLDSTPDAPLFLVPNDAQLAIRIGSGSINRPHIYFNSSANT